MKTGGLKTGRDDQAGEYPAERPSKVLGTFNLETRRPGNSVNS